MAKRFTDSNKFEDIWYRKLPLLQKVLWEFLLAECNHAGILTNFDLEMASFKIGANIKKEDLEIFENRIIFITDNTLFIPKFLSFQYGEFNPKNRVHTNVLKELEKYNITAPWTERSRSGDEASTLLKNKNKNKKIDNTSNKQIDTSSKLYGEYLNVYLDKEQYGKLLAICASEKLLNELINSFSSNIEVGKERPYKAELPNAHFERLKSYYNFRRKNPEKFAKEQKQTRPDSKTYKPEQVVISEDEKADIAEIQARIKSSRRVN